MRGWAVFLSLASLGAVGCVAPGDEPPTQGDPTPARAACLGPDGGVDGAEAAWPEIIDRGLELGVQERDRRNRGAAVADFNGDGYPDIWLANPHDPSSLFLSDGEGGYERQEPAPTSGVDAGASVADYDGDGDPDLLIGCGGFTERCGNRLFRNDGVNSDGEVVFTDQSALSTLSEHERFSFGPSWADYDGDGDLDVFMPSKAEFTDDMKPLMEEASMDLMYRNEGDGTFVDVTVSSGLGTRGHNHQSAWADLDNDGDMDLVMPSLLGPNAVYDNQGDGVFADVTADGLHEPYAAFGAIVEDFDGDGAMDVVFNAHRPLGEGSTRLFLGDGAGGFEDVSEILDLDGQGGPVRAESMGFQVGDLDQDGWFEVLLGNGRPQNGAVNHLFTLMPDESGELVAVNRSASIDFPAPEDPAWTEPQSYPYRSHGAVFHDFDLDGRPELFLGNGGTFDGVNQDEPNRFFFTEGGQENRSLRIELVGTGMNRYAIGARVVVRGQEPGGPAWQVVRHVHRSSGFNSSQPPALLVGLGRCEGPVEVEVRWPDGETEVAASEPDDRVLVLAR